MTEKIKVFVYGTLKKYGGNHGLLERVGAEYLGDHTTPSEFRMFSLMYYPGVVRGGNTPITGEIYEVSKEEGLAALDRLEGYPDLYTREEIDTPEGPAWIYLYNYPIKDSHTELHDGVWHVEGTGV